MIDEKGEINEKIIQALWENKEARIEKIVQEMDQLEDADTLFEIDPKIEKKILKSIKNHNKPYYKYINSAAKKAAIFIVVLLVAFTTSLITVESFRTEFTEFIVQTYEKFSLIFLADSDDENTLTVIEEYYAPTWLPDGFEIEFEDKQEKIHYIYYIDTEYNKISFIQSIIFESGLNFDNENYQLEKVIINEIEYIYFYNDESKVKYIVFNKYNYIFNIYAENITEEELFDIVESIELIN